jgi:hypothetical protein
MADMRRRGPEPPPGTPRIEHKPGLADEMLRELAPLLAEEGIDVDNIDDPTSTRRSARWTARSNGATWSCSAPSAKPATSRS